MTCRVVLHDLLEAVSCNLTNLRSVVVRVVAAIEPMLQARWSESSCRRSDEIVDRCDFLWKPPDRNLKDRPRTYATAVVMPCVQNIAMRANNRREIVVRLVAELTTRTVPADELDY